MTPLDTAIDRSLDTIRQRAGPREPRVAIVLGSGWHGVAEQLRDAVTIRYPELPAFPTVGVAGHAGALLLGTLGGVEVALLSGRQHAYETGRADAMKGAIRTLARCGVRVLVPTNAAGSLDPAMRPGELMLIADHLNMVQRSPLIDEAGSERFVDLNDAYDAALRRTARDVAKRSGITLHEGVYAWMMGPQFETPAEIRMLRQLGAQAVGMSTVPETILARHAGMKVLALSLLTNMGCGMEAEALSHAHTLDTARHASANAVRLLEALLPALVP